MCHLQFIVGDETLSGKFSALYKLTWPLSKSENDKKKKKKIDRFKMGLHVYVPYALITAPKPL